MLRSSSIAGSGVGGVGLRGATTRGTAGTGGGRAAPDEMAGARRISGLGAETADSAVTGVATNVAPARDSGISSVSNDHSPQTGGSRTATAPSSPSRGPASRSSEAAASSPPRVSWSELGGIRPPIGVRSCGETIQGIRPESDRAAISRAYGIKCGIYRRTHPLRLYPPPQCPVLSGYAGRRAHCSRRPRPQPQEH